MRVLGFGLRIQRWRVSSFGLGILRFEFRVSEEGSYVRLIDFCITQL